MYHHTAVESCKGESRILHLSAIKLVSDKGASYLGSDSFIFIITFETVGLHLLPSASLPFHYTQLLELF